MTQNTVTAINPSSCYLLPKNTVQNYFNGGYMNVIMLSAAH